MTPAIVDAAVSVCPDTRCAARQREPRQDWAQCDTCGRLFPAATWLFEGWDPATRQRSPGFATPREGFATAVFVLYLLHSAGEKIFPVRLVGPGYACSHVGDVDLEGVRYHHLGIELHGQPDVIVRRHGSVIHIENKPWAGGGRGRENSEDQIPRYCRTAQQTGASFYVLISCGNAQDTLWRVLRDSKVPIILWEEVLSRMDAVGFATHLAPGGSLRPYYETHLREA